MYFSSVWLLLLCVPLIQASDTNGVSMTVASGETGNSSPRTTYVQKDRERSEYRNSVGREMPDGSMQTIYGPRLARIIRCDLGQYLELNLDTSEYTSSPYPRKRLTREEIGARGLESPVPGTPRNPTIRIEVETTDTGDRKEMFGRMARHVITKRKQTPLEGSRSEPQESITDGWYIDFDQRLSCDPKPPEGVHGHSYGYVGMGSGKYPMEKPEFVTVGEPETGFPLYSLTTSQMTYKSGDGTRKRSDSKNETRVTQFEEGPIDPALFQIPPGFKLVERIERNPPASAFNGKARTF